jgi:hypothetical protein
MQWIFTYGSPHGLPGSCVLRGAGIHKTQSLRAPSALGSGDLEANESFAYDVEHSLTWRRV